MTEENEQTEFWNRADEIIAVANGQLQSSTVGKVSASLLYAAARFNAFNTANSAIDLKEMKKSKDEAIDYFTGQYRKVLEENLADYIDNFDRYRETNQ